jgi:outer membrane protein assembly factor BamB
MTPLLPCLVVLVLGGETVWPGFLGAGAKPVDPATIPLTWSPQQNVAWKADLPGHGQSSPVIWKQNVYVTSVEGPQKDKYHLRAVHLADGKPLWVQSLESSDKVENTQYVSRSAPTPVVDAAGVYAFFESGDVLCVSHDGQQRWRRSLSRDYGKFESRHGVAASPVQTEHAVILLLDHQGPSCLLALNKADGALLWKTDRSSRTSWSSPYLVNAHDRAQVVCSSSGSVDGYDAASGELLWSYTEVGGNTMATPASYAPGRFLIGASAGREGESARADDARKSNLAMEIELVGGQPRPKVLWRTEEAAPSFGSPMVHAGHAYWVNRSGVVYCLDAATGEPRYTQRLKQSCWATPLGAGDRIYFFGKDGLTTVLAAGPEVKVLAENTLWQTEEPSATGAAGTSPNGTVSTGRILYGVAAVNGSLLVRAGDMLYCLRP